MTYRFTVEDVEWLLHRSAALAALPPILKMRLQRLLGDLCDHLKAHSATAGDFEGDNCESGAWRRSLVWWGQPYGSGKLEASTTIVPALAARLDRMSQSNAAEHSEKGQHEESSHPPRTIQLVSHCKGIGIWGVIDRSDKSPLFSIRERALATAIFTSSSWFPAGTVLRTQRSAIRLPPRAIQALELLRTGLAEKNIASEMGISHNTAHMYVKQIYAYFGVHSRAELLIHLLSPVSANLSPGTSPSSQQHSSAAKSPFASAGAPSWKHG